MVNDSRTLGEKVRQILFTFRSTPLLDGRSPAERYLGRRLRIRIDVIKPVHPPKNKVCNGPVRELKVGDKVIARIYKYNKPSWSPAEILQKFGKLHYLVQLANGHKLRRHIYQLRKACFQESENALPTSCTSTRKTS